MKVGAIILCIVVCCSVLQCVAVCFSVVQCVTVCCSAGLRHPVAEKKEKNGYYREKRSDNYYCWHFKQSVLQCVAVCCRVLLCVAVYYYCWHFKQRFIKRTGTTSSSSRACCSVLQCVAVCCRVLQCVAVCCSLLQSVAVPCNSIFMN